MIKGLYSAASAMMAGMERQKLLAHNVSNLETAGFKEILSSLSDFDQTQVEFSPGDITKAGRVRAVGQIGLGVMLTPETTLFQQGALMNTRNELDLAIEGPGFFRIRTPAGERLTRDGRFVRDADGTLTTIEGHAVLNDGGQPIRLNEGAIQIQPNGTITVDGEEAGRIGLAAFEDPAASLQRSDNNTFLANGAANLEAAGSVHQFYLEGSNADPAHLMTQMVSVARSYEAAQRMVQTQDELLGQTIATLGRTR